MFGRLVLPPPPWRVFVSRTSELDTFPAGHSYLAAALDAVVKSGNVPVEMKHFDASPGPTAGECADQLRGCAVHVSILGPRYGSLVPDDPLHRSYTEYEYDTAGELGIPRLVFCLDQDALMPQRWAASGTQIDQQRAFVARTRTNGLTAVYRSVDALHERIVSALRLLAERAAHQTGQTDDPGHALLAAPRRYLAPRLDGSITERPDLLASLLHQLTRVRASAIRVTALHGTTGFGKTTLAQQACGRPEVTDRYPGGVLWVTLGPRLTPSELTGKINDLIEHLTGRRTTLIDPEQAGLRLGALLEEQQSTLLVIDDAGSTAELRPFLLGGLDTARLVTTRQPGILPAGAGTIRVDRMLPEQASHMLTRGLPHIDPDTLARLLARTGHWPLLLSLANGALKQDVRNGSSPEAVASALADQLTAHGPASLDARDEAGGPAVAVALRASLSTLAERDQIRYTELAIFPPDIDLPSAVLDLYWSAAGEMDTEIDSICRHFVGRSLASGYRADHRYLRIHGVLLDYLRSTLSPLTQRDLHGRLLDAAAKRLLPRSEPDARTAPGHPWWLLPSTPEVQYLWDHLARHLTEAGRSGERDALVCDLRWVDIRLRQHGPAAVETDLHIAGGPLAAGLGRALAQNAHLLTPTDPEHALTAILRSRLVGYPDLRPLLDRYPPSVGIARLEPVWPLPDRPSPALHRILTGHSATVAGCAISPDSTWLATTSTDATIRICEVATGATQRILTGHAGPVTGCAISADGTWLATTSNDGTARLWDADTGTLRHELTGHTDTVTGCAISPDSTWLATACHDGAVRSWTATGRLRDIYTGHTKAVAGCAIAPDGTWAASVSWDGTAQLWDARTGVTLRVLSGHTGAVTGCAIGPDGRWIATASHDQTVRIWGASAGELQHTLPNGSIATGVAIAVSGAWLATASWDGTARIWDLPTLRRPPVTPVEQPRAARWWARFRRARRPKPPPEPDRSSFVSGSGHNELVSGCAIAGDGRWLATASWDATVRIWNVATGLTEHRLAGHRSTVTGCAISPDGSWLASSSHDRTIRIWDRAKAATARVLTGHTDAVNSCAISPDGQWLASAGSDRTVRVWDPDTGDVRHTLTGHTHGVTCCAVAPNGQWIATASRDETTRLYDLRTGKTRQLLTGHTDAVTSCAIAPDGQWLATASRDRSVRIWDAQTGAVRQILTGHTAAVTGCAISPDGRWLATVSNDRSIRIWQPTTSACVTILRVNSLLSAVTTAAPNRVAATGASGVYLLALQ